MGIEILLQTSRLMNYHPQSQAAIPFIIIAMSSIISITDKLSSNHKATILTLTTMSILQIVHVSSCGSLRHSAGKSQVKCFHFKSKIGVICCCGTLFQIPPEYGVHQSPLDSELFPLHLFCIGLSYVRSSQITRRRVGFSCV